MVQGVNCVLNALRREGEPLSLTIGGVNAKLRELDELQRILERLFCVCRRHEPTTGCPVLETLEDDDGR